MSGPNLTHSGVGASSMERWEKCPGSVRLCSTIPNTSSSYAEEGTIAHTLGEYKLKNGHFPMKDPEGVTEEMKDAVNVYVDYVKSLIQEIGNHKDNKVFLELRFEHKKIHKDFRGTSDCVIYDAKNKTLHVIDYKHGAGKKVYATGNVQLLYYGIGSAYTIKAPIEKVKLTIVQPRFEGEEQIDHWEVDFLDLAEFQIRVVDAIKKTEEKNAPLVVGEEQCRFCSAKPVCPALRNKALDLIKTDFQDTMMENGHPAPLDQVKMGSVLMGIEAVEEWCKAMKSYAYEQALKGRVPEGFKLVPKRATRKWADEDKTKAALNSLVNPNVLHECYTQPELKSPAQIEKTIGGKAGKEIVEGLTVSISSGDKLVPLEHDGEVTTKRTLIERMFSQF
jgi:hypothetical protein